MNGAESLIRTLVDLGVDCCFANPGTSEMHLVQAIDKVDGMRPVLGLFEGVCTGAADGYGRMTGRPALTLLHLGAGLGNGIANLHNARRADTPLLNVVGDHAIHHIPYEAPLTADIEGVARPVSSWVRTARTPAGLAQDGVEAVQAAMSPSPTPLGNISTLIVPADCAWGEAFYQAPAPWQPQRPKVADEAVQAAAQKLNDKAILLIDGPGLTESGVKLAGRIAAATGCRIMAPTFPSRVEAGPDLPAVGRIPYFPEQITALLETVPNLVLAGADAPVGFFAYQNMPANPVPASCHVQRMTHRHDDVLDALARLAEAVGAPAEFTPAGLKRPDMPEGPLNAMTVAQILGVMAPEQSIFASDSGGGGAAGPVMARAARHTWLGLTGGAIGQGGPVATGAAAACPDRQVFSLLGDGAAMYTFQALWTQAREKMNVITVIFSNRSYNILSVEYRRLGVNEIGDKAGSMFDLSGPDIDWAGLGRSMGVPSSRAGDCASFASALKQALEADGPYLIEADLTGG